MAVITMGSPAAWTAEFPDGVEPLASKMMGSHPLWIDEFPQGFEKGGGVGSYTPTFVMRGYDQTLLTIVFWTSTHVDGSAADYTGPGPVIDVVTHFVKGPD